MLSDYAFVSPDAVYPLPGRFNFDEYIETERELWALFPETDGLRVNFVQIGLTANIYAEVRDDRSELEPDETYILMPFADNTLRPVRMRSCRRLTLSEYRMGHLTAIKLVDTVASATEVIREVGMEILGPEVLQEAELRMRRAEEE